jgi:Lipocalin-like domain
MVVYLMNESSAAFLAQRARISWFGRGGRHAPSLTVAARCPAWRLHSRLLLSSTRKVARIDVRSWSSSIFPPISSLLDQMAVQRKEILMSTFKCLVAGVGWLVAAQPSFADDREKVIGIWKLVSQEIEIQASGQKEPVMGRSPTGYAIFTPEGRVMFVLTGEGRKPPQTVQDRADLLNSMAAYTGMYRLEGDKWITQVDVAWNPEWVGTEQTRFFKLDGDRLHVTSTWRIMPNWADKGMQRSLLVFEKTK